MTDPTRGVLFPDRLPQFTRVEPEPAVADLVEWSWVPEWDLPEERSSVQRVLAYPAANLVIESGRVTLYGATTRATDRVLFGAGWAVGAVLRPAVLAALSAAPADLVDSAFEMDAAEMDAVALDAAEPDAAALAASVAEVMPGHAARAAAILGRWLDVRVGARTSEAVLANEMARLLMTDAAILRVEDAASRLAVSVRTLQRLAHRTVGLPPAAIIRRRRLQEAAQRVREHPDESLADIAAELGYVDQAHLANDFRTVLGFTASEYRAT